MTTLAVRRCWTFLLLLGLAAPLWAVPGSWRALGPDGGEIFDLAFAPSRPQALYAATISGVFRSLDGGASWSYANTGLAENTLVNSLAVDPVRPLTVYTAQDGTFYRSLDSGATWIKRSALAVSKIVLPVRGSGTVYVAGYGLYKSVDGGATWRSLTRGLPASYRPVDLVADPIDPSRLYTVVSTDSHVYGVFKSVDGGLTWKRADQGLPVDQAISCLAIDPLSPRTLYAGTEGHRVYKSRDGGALWRPQGALMPDNESIFRLWVSRAGTVFVSADRLFRAESNGRWTDVSQGLPERGGVHALLFPPGDARSLLAGVVTFGVRRGGVFASSDGGSSWGLRSSDLSALDVTSAAVAPDALWAVANETLFKSADRGETWKQVQFEPAGAVTLVAVDPAAPENVYAVLYDGTLWRSRDGGESWEDTACPVRSPVRLVFDPRSPSTLYAAGSGIARSTDGGATWTPLLDGSFSDLAAAPVPPFTLYAFGLVRDSSSYQILRSTDGGGTWAGTAVLLTGVFESLGVDPRTPETLFRVVQDFVVRSTDGGATWPLFGNRFRFYNRVLYPLLFPVSPANLHVGVWSDNVYRLMDTADPGSWEPLGKSPGRLSFNVLAADRQDPCRIYAGTTTRGLLAFTESGTAQCP